MSSALFSKVPPRALYALAGLFLFHVVGVHLYTFYLYLTPERTTVIEEIVIPKVNKTIVTLEPALEIKETKLQVLKKRTELTDAQRERIAQRLEGLAPESQESLDKVKMKWNQTLEEWNKMQEDVRILYEDTLSQLKSLSVPEEVSSTESEEAIDPQALVQLQELLSLATYVNYETTELQAEFAAAQSTLDHFLSSSIKPTSMRALFQSLPTRQSTKPASCDETFLIKSRKDTGNPVDDDDDDLLSEEDGPYATERDLNELTLSVEQELQKLFRDNILDQDLEQTVKSPILAEIVSQIQDEMREQGAELQSSLDQVTFQLNSFVEKKQTEIDSDNIISKPAMESSDEVDSSCVTEDDVDDIMEYVLERRRRGYGLKESLVEILETILPEGWDDQFMEPFPEPVPTSTSSPILEREQVNQKSVWSLVDNEIIPKIVKSIDVGIEAISGYNEQVDRVIDFIVGEEGSHEEEDSVGLVFERNLRWALTQIPLPQELFNWKQKAGILAENM